MDNKKLFFLAEYLHIFDDSPLCPYPPLHRHTVIEKDLSTGKFHYIDFGMEDTSWRFEEIYNTFEEAFEYFYNYDMKFYLFEIQEIDTNKKFYYTKKLIEKLNLDQYKTIDDLPTKSYKEHLGIELKLSIKSAINDLRIISLTKKNNNSEINHFFVGKLEVQGNTIIIKNEKNDIIHLTSGENLTIDTEEILADYYWYFKK